jgi:hypothetical protein
VTKQQQTEMEEQGAKHKKAMLGWNKKKNDRLKRRTKVLNARRLIVISREENVRR